ncbi:hypothetical protein RSAG8_10687, partial [Rhizoctonia solani AG-8 WAC10335]
MDMSSSEPGAQSCNTPRNCPAIPVTAARTTRTMKTPTLRFHPYAGSHPTQHNLVTTRSQLAASTAASRHSHPKNFRTASSFTKPSSLAPNHSYSLLDKALNHALAPRTRSTYSSAVTRFTSWCDNNQVPICDQFPATDSTLSHYAASFADLACVSQSCNTPRNCPAIPVTAARTTRTMKTPTLRFHPYAGSHPTQHNLVTTRSQLAASTAASRHSHPKNFRTASSFTKPSSLAPNHSYSLLDKALNHALAPRTLSNYTSAVTRFTSWCDNNQVPVCDRFPATDSTLSRYAASFAGSAAGSTAANAISALKTWHALNGAPWNGGPQLPLVLRGVANLAPESSRRPERPGVSRDMLIQLYERLDHKNPLHAAVFAAATVAFWGQCRLGELLGTSRRVHNPKTYPSRSSLASTPIRDIVIPHQIGPADPIRALSNHLEVNCDAKPWDHLFAFQSSKNGVFRCLTKEVFLRICNDVWRALGHPRITGHCFRIGGTNAYMESGVAADIVKSKGRWESDAFLVYWRNKNRLAAAQTERIILPT